MIVPDVNLLVHAYNRNARAHGAAKRWWEDLLSRETTVVALPWVTLLGFVRILTHPRAFTDPMPVGLACGAIRGWLERPHVTILHPGERHLAILAGLLESVGSGGNLTTDAHLAALAIEHQAELHTSDADFARFPGLRWKNPLR